MNFWSKGNTELEGTGEVNIGHMGSEVGDVEDGFVQIRVTHRVAV